MCAYDADPSTNQSVSANNILTFHLIVKLNARLKKIFSQIGGLPLVSVLSTHCVFSFAIQNPRVALSVSRCLFLQIPQLYIIRIQVEYPADFELFYFAYTFLILPLKPRRGVKVLIGYTLCELKTSIEKSEKGWAPSPPVPLFRCAAGVFDRQNKNVLSGIVLSTEYGCGRGDRIRTCDLLVPNANWLVLLGFI